MIDTFDWLTLSQVISYIANTEQDELWVNAHLWYPRSSANRK